MSATCTHPDSIELTELPEAIPGCEDCLAIGGAWVHLRMCQSCGRVGCCDSSPRRHASAHARSTAHPVVRSAEPGEDAYGLARRDRSRVVDAAIETHDWCYDIVREAVADGHQTFLRDWRGGGEKRAGRTRRWIAAHREHMGAVLDAE